jgi:hypothetical protein
MRAVKAHYIHSNESARVPSRFVIMDCESTRERDDKGEIQKWSLAVAEFLEWTKQGCLQRSTFRFETATEMWEAISSFTRSGRRTVLYAHNLNYDLRISLALSVLPALGWQMKDMRLDGRGSWSKWTREKASLILCDSASIFPVKLQDLGNLLGIPKLPLPPSSQRERLFERCERDVAILTDAVIRYVSWMRTGILGNWQMTGASQAWSHWRHGHYTHKILIHNDDEALAAERAAMHAGRCEAWRWGTYSDDVYFEYDWQNSYPRIARDVGVPTRLAGTIRAPSSDRIHRLQDKYCVIAEVSISTATPCVPVSYEGRVLWPTGNFTTTLWDSEIDLLRECNADFRVRKAWIYDRRPALKDWAEWILSSLNSLDSGIEPWQKLILKHWSRALIGRFGMRYRSWEPFASTTEMKVCMSTLLNLENGKLSELLQVGGDVFTSGDLKEIDDGCPQVTSYIMSVARAKLWRAIQQIGTQNVYYMDTDSVVVNSAGHKVIQLAGGQGIFEGLRSKGRYKSIQLFGPRAIILDKRPTVAGMPKRSVEVEDRRWLGEVWRGATESIRLGEHDRVRVSDSSFRLRYSERRRAFNSDGTTVPYLLPGMVPDGQIVDRRTKAQRQVDNGLPKMLV